MLVDDGGDATLLIHEGVKAEKAFAENKTLPDPESTEDPEVNHHILLHPCSRRHDRTNTPLICCV